IHARLTRQSKEGFPMSQPRKANSNDKPVAVVIGATSKWQSDGRNTLLVHGKALDDSDLPVGARWGIGGAIAQKFAREGFFVVLTTRSAANASALEKAIIEQGGEGMIVELDLVSRESISRAFATIRKHVGDPDVLVYNAGYLEGRDLPPEKRLLGTFPSGSSWPARPMPGCDRSPLHRKEFPSCERRAAAPSSTRTTHSP